MINRLKNKYKDLQGSNLSLEMEDVIFNSISVVIFFYLLTTSISNFIYGQYFLATVLLLLGLILLTVYFNTGFFKKYHFYFGLFYYPLISVNFYLNDGIAGPSAYVFLMFHIIMMLLSPKRYYLFWLCYNAFFYTALIYIDLFHPLLIPVNYSNLEHQFWDHIVTYWISILGIFAIIAVIKEYYGLQKKETETKSRELLEVNHMLGNSNEQKNKIIALISHDLRSPLNSIVTILEFSQAGELTEAELFLVRKELLAMTSNTIKMLDSILEWASLEMQNKEINITETDVKSACESVMVVYNMLATEKKISLITEYINNPIVKTDMGKVLLIIRNLTQNAIKFTPNGGKINFTVRQIGEKVEISIADTGIGLSEEKLKNLFLLNIQTTYGTEKEKGTGLGLYLSQENARKIGANISVQSQKGKGSIFTLTLPVSLDHKCKEKTKLP